MRQNYAFFLLSFFAFALTACSNSQDQGVTSVSGEIVNPKSPYIVILKNNSVLDTVALEPNNHFYYQFDKDVKAGLYRFSHDYGNYDQTQMFYIKQGDSLQLRLNTREFDRSLMYTGSGAIANNFLMKVFLDYLDNDNILLHYYRITPAEFEQIADSIRRAHFANLKTLHQQQAVSDDFTELMKNVIDYANYGLREHYFFLVNKYSSELKAELPDDFLAYREEVNFNNEALQTYYIYQFFLDYFLKNKSVQNCLAAKTEATQNCFNLRSERSLETRLKIADSLFELKSLRAHFLTRYAAKLVVRSRTAGEIDSLISFLSHVDYDKEKLNDIKHLASVQKRQFIGNIGQLHLSTPTGKKVRIASLLTKPTVLYYWSLKYKAHQIGQHEKINTLRKRYPEVNFIGINIDNATPEAWKTSLQNFGYAAYPEYQLICPPEQQEFYRVYLNELIFVNQEGQILGDLNLYDIRLEENLLGLLNK